MAAAKANTCPAPPCTHTCEAGTGTRRLILRRRLDDTST